MKETVKTVLFVDDDLNYRDIYVESLENAGLVVSVTDNGLTAFELIQKQYFDVLITDYNMPEMDGKELIEKTCALENRPKKIVLLTSMPNGEEIALRIKNLITIKASILYCNKLVTVAELLRIICRL